MIPDQDIPVFLFLLIILITFGVLVQAYERKLDDLKSRRERDKEEILNHLDENWDENSYH
mgnify:CR=1 FL=1